MAPRGLQEIEISERDWRADPKDGLRPFKHIKKIIEFKIKFIFNLK